MSVYITQGHEAGIGLEVFFKSCLLLPKAGLNQLCLLAFPDSVARTLETLKLPFTIHADTIEVAGLHLRVQWLKEINHSESFTALELGMRLAESGGVLFTLPTAKDQFPGYPGHTEYFRACYHKPELGMFFSAPDLQVLLLSDHIPVAKLSESLSAEVIFSRLDQALKTLQQWQRPIARVLVSGLNPHAGENGLIGDEDNRVTMALERLRQSHQITMSGPIPGDTMLLNQGSPQDLLVYLFHDQGLGVFKGLQGFIGSNITLGLPYPRVSPDHGTSFPLFGKNCADYRGCAWSLKEALALAERTAYGKDSGKQS